MKPNRLIISSFLTMLALLAPLPVSGTNLSAPVSPDMVCSIEFTDKMNPWSALNANSIGEMSGDGSITESHTAMSATSDFAPWSLLNAHSVGETSDDGYFALTPGPDAVAANLGPWSALNAQSIGEMAADDSKDVVSSHSDSRLSASQCTNAALDTSPVIPTGNLAIRGGFELNTTLGNVLA